MRSSLATFLDDFRRHGDATALVAYRGNRRLASTWRELATLADRCAAEIIRRQIPMGERVVLWGSNGLEWMGAFFGCLQRGVIVVPLDPAGALDFAERVIENTRPKLILGDRELLSSVIGETATFAFEDFNQQLPQPPGGDLRDPALTLDTPFQILFTSGTTAEPKGIVHTHRNVLASLDPIEHEMQKYLSYERPFHPIRFLHTLPLSHVFGQFMGLWIPPLLAAEVHFENRLQAQRLVEIIHRERISVVCSVPRVLDLLRSHLLALDPHLPERIQAAAGQSVWKRWWRFRKIHRLFGYKFWAFVCGGASLSSDLESFWTTLGFALVQGYGMTETSALITLNHPFKPGQGTIGKVLPGRDVRITDEGEILVRGDMVSRATWQQGSLHPNDSEWLATGDLAQRDDQGQLRFVGRKSQVIVTPSGVNIHPEDVEEALNAQAGVQASAVVPLLTSAGTEPVAVLLFRGSREEAQRAVVAANRQLAEYQQVRQWRLWPELDLPRTSTGKVRRPRVTEWVNAQQAQSSSGAVADPLLSLVLSISHASADHAGDEARLSEDLGLDSLGRVQLQSELEQRLGLTLDDVTLEQVVTLGDLRRALGLDHAEALSATPETTSSRSAQWPASAGASPVETDIYPHWPWWSPIWLLRAAYTELIQQPLVRFLAKPRVERPPHLRPSQPVLLIANHVTAYDMPLILYGLPGRMRRHVAAAMAGNILWDWRHMRNVGPTRSFLSRMLDPLGPLTWFVVTALVNVFPLPRSAGFRRAFQHAGEALDRGYNVLVFPEGHRTETGLQPFRPGIGILVRESKAPVIPVALAGLSELKEKGKGWFRSGALIVRVGEPIRFSPSDTPEQITEHLYDVLKSMLDRNGSAAAPPPSR
ncbi:MAG TPA: AMP-binding protein [Acidobacteriaceae bacterium]|jgi:long-chain acyl-CoA synthetase|nr:AMP-binding protein [Acidobacteriaceae bacterium]